MKTLYTTYTRAFTSLLFILSLAFLPVLAGADNDDKNKEDKLNKINGNKTVSCLQVYNYFVAQGWLPANMQASISSDCLFPFEKFHKWYNDNKTHVPDGTAPTISNISINSSRTSAKVSWTTNERTRSAVFYSTAIPVVTRTDNIKTGNILNSVSSANSSVKVDGTFKTNHSINLNNLQASTTYYVVVASRDNNGNVTISNVVSFTTNPSIDSAGPTINNISSLATASNIRLMWKTNEPARTRLFYGSTGALDLNASGTLVLSNDELKTSHSFVLPALTAGTPLYFVVESTDRLGNKSISSQYLISSSF